MSDSIKGRCFCGSVEFEVTGAPAVMGYCHCKDCTTWLGAPVNAFSLWPRDSVRIIKGDANVGVFNKTENAYRKFCKTCGGPLMADHPGMGLVDVYPNLMPGFTHVPAMHVFYEHKTISMKDGLRKFKDLPAEYGGSGEMLPE